MKIYKSKKGIIIESESDFYLSSFSNWTELVNSDDLNSKLSRDIETAEKIQWDQSDIESPLDEQEIWAAGVTYYRSREARMEESKESGAAVFYSKVYEAERPELFFKSTAQRVAEPNGAVRIRKDSKWNVPEPELTLFINSKGTIAGYTVGNDMSSRDIEGENPLYLPQAKCYQRSAAIGPCLYVPKEPIAADSIIHMSIERHGKIQFEGEISINQMKRSHEELAKYLCMEMEFPTGVYLMTGTCLVPDDNFTLNVGDYIHISIDGIGTLTNTVEIG